MLIGIQAMSFRVLTRTYLSLITSPLKSKGYIPQIHTLYFSHSPATAHKCQPHYAKCFFSRSTQLVDWLDIFLTPFDDKLQCFLLTRFMYNLCVCYIKLFISCDIRPNGNEKGFCRYPAKYARCFGRIYRSFSLLLTLLCRRSI